jgi:serine/threonine protein phosphatase PrpC
MSVDDSWASEQILSGVPREVAESAPQAHAITRWLGLDAPDHTPRTVSRELDTAGWLLVCSDGLWNYASEATALQRLIGQLDSDGSAPLHLAQALVQWANEQGGKDNISVALARHEVGVHGAPPVDHHEARRS